MDIRNTKIWFGEDKVLAQKIFNRLKELGVDSHNNWRTFDDCEGRFNCYRVDDEYYLWTCNTKEQFDNVEYKEITTKDLGMEKKQIGWKFKTQEFKHATTKLIAHIAWNMVGKDFEQHSDVEDYLKSLGVLEMWCDAVYEKETFQEHDWVYITSGNFGWVKQGDVVQLGGEYWMKYGVREQGGKQHISAITSEHPNGNSGLGDISFRKANVEEIKEAQIIKIGDYTVNIVSSSQVIINDYTYSYKDVENVLAVLSLKKVGWIAVGCNSQINLTKSTVERILKAMENA